MILINYLLINPWIKPDNATARRPGYMFLRQLIIQEPIRENVSMRMRQQKCKKMPGFFFLLACSSGPALPVMTFAQVWPFSPGPWPIAYCPRQKKDFVDRIAIGSWLHAASVTTHTPCPVTGGSPYFHKCEKWPQMTPGWAPDRPNQCQFLVHRSIRNLFKNDL